MRRIFLLFLIISAVLLLSTCEEFDPQWMGTWVATVDDVEITLDLEKWEGTVTVVNNDTAPLSGDALLTIIKGSLDGDETTMTATITYIYQEYKDVVDPLVTEDPFEIIYVVTTLPSIDCEYCLGLKWPCSVSYVIEGDTITLTGELISALTKGPNTLTATKQ